ncbi:MAG: cation transporter [Candidatus Omnitrophica bacterium]|nr:cation transporter [Candidatus Omnitrophota bacterium]
MTHSHKKKSSRLIISILLNALITVVEIIGGIVSGSLALISDALHNFTDVFALIISLIAIELQKHAHTETRTFGYKRAEVLAALLNASILVIVSFFLFKEAFVRFAHPVNVNTNVMITVALIGLIANAIAVLLLRKDAHGNMNIRTAYLHLFTDTLSSVAVVLGGIFIWLFGINWVDPLLTVLIGVYVLKEGYAIVMQAVRILMQHVPKGISIKSIQSDIEQIEGIKDIHHAHLWSVTEDDIYFEAHINATDDIRLSESCLLKDKIEQLLKTKYAITHVTLQLECDSCKNVSLIHEEGKR